MIMIGFSEKVVEGSRLRFSSKKPKNLTRAQTVNENELSRENRFRISSIFAEIFDFIRRVSGRKWPKNEKIRPFRSKSRQGESLKKPITGRGEGKAPRI